MVKFSVSWSGKTALQIDQIIPQMREYAKGMEEFEQNDFEHLVVVCHPETETEQNQDDFIPEPSGTEQVSDELTRMKQFYQKDAQTAAEYKESEIESEMSDVILPSPSPPLEGDSETSTTTSTHAQCGSEAEEKIVANREIDDVIAKDHIELSKRDQRELFEMFEEDRMVTPEVDESALDEKVFRFAVYETNELPLGEDESSDIVDIPINCDELTDEIDEQINRALDKAEEGDVDLSQDELPSDSSGGGGSENDEQDNDEPPTVTTSNARQLEFEYENAKNTEIKEEQKAPKPEPNNQPGWEIADDRENEKPLPPGAFYVENSGDIRERTHSGTSSRGEDMARNVDGMIPGDARKNFSVVRDPVGPSCHGEKGFNTEGGVYKAPCRQRSSDSGDNRSESGREYRPRNEQRPDRGQPMRRGFERRSNDGFNNYNGRHSRGEGQGYGGTEWNGNQQQQHHRRSWNNGAPSDNSWSNNRGYNHGSAGRRSGAYSCGTGGGYNSSDNNGGNEARNGGGYRSDNGGMQQRHGNGGQVPPMPRNAGDNNNPAAHAFNRNNNEQQQRHSGAAYRPMQQRKSAAYGHVMSNAPPPGGNGGAQRFQSDHCNRDDFCGKTKQMNDESFAHVRSNQSQTPQGHYNDPHCQW